MMLLADDWKDYELIDTGNGEKLERWEIYTKKTRSADYMAYQE